MSRYLAQSRATVGHDLTTFLGKGYGADVYVTNFCAHTRARHFKRSGSSHSSSRTCVARTECRSFPPYWAIAVSLPASIAVAVLFERVSNQALWESMLAGVGAVL